MGCGSSKPPPKPKTPIPNPEESGGPSARQPAPPDVRQGVQQTTKNPPAYSGQPGVELSEFPTPVLLVRSQEQWHAQGLTPSAEKEGVPGPFPPQSSKAEFLAGRNFVKVDQGAINVPELSAFDTMTTLVEHLTSGTSDDIDIIRRFYVWITSQNLRSLGISSFPHRESPAYFLLLIAIRARTLSLLLEELCRLANIPCKKLTGKVKDNRYRPGDDIISTCEWCAVYVQNSWRHIFFSPEETARNSQDDPRDTSAEGVDYGFLIDPEALVYKALCDQPEWQLLGRHVTYEEFQTMAYLHDGYFTEGIEDFSQVKCVVETTNGEVTFSFKGEIDLTCSVTNLCPIKGQIRRDFQEFTLIHREEDNSVIKIMFPEVGKFKVDIGSKCGVGGKVRVRPVAEYTVLCREPCFQYESIGSIKNTQLGLNSKARKLGISANSHSNGIIHINTGEIEIEFLCDPSIADDITATLEWKGRTVGEMEKFVVNYFDVNSGKMVYFMKFIKRGKYLLKLFHTTNRNIQQPKKTFVGAYIIDVAKPCDFWVPSPVDRIGYTKRTYSIWMKTKSHHEPVINTTSSECCVIVDTAADVQLVSQVVNVTQNMQLSLSSEYHLTEHEDTQYSFFVRFPRDGLYNLQIFAESKTNTTGVSKHIYTYFILVPSLIQIGAPFPRQLGKPMKNCHLFSPLTYTLQSNQEVLFEIHLDGATSVFLLDRATNIELEEMNGRWKKHVKTGEIRRDMTLAAIINNRKTNLYVFHIASPEDWEAILEKQAVYTQTLTLRQRQRKEKLQAEQEQKEREDMTRQQAIEKRRQEYERRLPEIQEAEARCRKESQADYQSRLAEYQRESAEQSRRQKMSVEEAEPIMREELLKHKKRTNSEMMSLRRRYSGMMENVARDNLRDATQRRNREDIEKAIETYRNAGLKDRGELSQAQRVLAMLKERDNLRSAMDRQDPMAIRECCIRIRNRGYERPLQQDLIDAERLLELLSHTGPNDIVAPNLDKGTISEIRGYQRPPYPVHEIMQAVLLLVGEDEWTTSDWKTCQRLCITYGRNGLMRKLQDFNINTVHPEIIARAREILLDLDLYQVQNACTGISGLYIWGLGVTERGDDSGQNEDVIPADRDRQLEIFGREPPDGSVASARRVSMQIL